MCDAPRDQDARCRNESGRSARGAGGGRGARPGGTPATAAGAPGALSHFDLARKDCVGTARNTQLEGLVHGRRRRAVRRLLPDVDNTNVETLQYVVTDGVDLHRPAEPRHDLHGPVAGPDRDGLRGHQHRQERPLPAGHRLPDRPARATPWSCGPGSQRPGLPLKLYVRSTRRVNGNGGGGAGQRRRRRRRPSTRRPPALVSSDTNTGHQRGEPRLRGADCSARCAPTGRSCAATSGYAGTASDGLTQLDADHALGHDTPTRRTATSCRPRRLDRRGNGRSRSRSASADRRAGDRHRRRVGARAVRQHAGPRTRPAGSLRRTAERRRYGSPACPRRRPDAGPAVLPLGQRGEGQRGQDVPGRDRGLARQPVGPGGQRRRQARRQARLLRLLPRGLRPRPLRGVHRPARRRRPRDRAGSDPVPVRAPAAGRRPDATQLAAQRQARRRTPAATSSTSRRTRS